VFQAFVVSPTQPLRVLLVGATGTVGRATAQALAQRGYDTVAVVRSLARAGVLQSLAGVQLRQADVTQPESLALHGFKGEHFDAVVSCLASRTGLPEDAWAVDHQANLHVMKAAQAAGVRHFVLLSAICVQKPRLAFQQAKLAFEKELVASGLAYSIVRPTAFFKSLSGQIKRVQQGKPFLLFGDGRLTACLPISDADLATYLVDCLSLPERANQVLPIGGPGPAITPREQGERLFALLGQKPRFKQVPLALMDSIVAVLGLVGKVWPQAARKAELARIGRYYASESMLVLNPSTGRYDAAATPRTGSDTLFDYYAAVLRGQATPERGEHAVF
jgi:divinyl chlorophyllide a 8-vinyl-reductase